MTAYIVNSDHRVGLAKLTVPRHRIFQLALIPCLFWGHAAFGQVAACNRLIELSKLKNQTFSNSKMFEQEHRAMCQEYAQYKSTGKSMSGGVGYKSFSANLNRGSSNIESVASEYCEDNGSIKSSADAFQEYVELIAPGAYEAYRACLQLANNKISFTLPPTAIQPTNATFLISNNDVGSESASTMKFSASTGVTCAWDRASSNNGLKLLAGSSATLACKRSSPAEAGHVMIYAATLPNSAITVPWGRYVNGVPANVVAQYQDATSQLNQLVGSLRGAVVSFNATQCPVGWKAYLPAQGRFIRGIRPDGDKSVEPDGTRSPGNIQQDSFASHKHDRPQDVWNDGSVQDGTSASGDKWHGFGWYTDAVPKTIDTGSAGGAETRPKNVALLYCERL